MRQISPGMGQASGIYQIKHIPTGKIYVGSAVQIIRRWRQHVKSLEANSHHNIELQRAWNKHGSICFSFEVLEYVNEISDLLFREQHYIDSLSPYYNHCKIAGSRLGAVVSDASRIKMRDAHIGVKLDPNHHASLVGRKQSDETRAKKSAVSKGKPQSKEWVAARVAKIAKAFTVVSPSGLEHDILNLKRFCVEAGLSDSHMHQVSRGKRGHHKGWKCRAIDIEGITT